MARYPYGPPPPAPTTTPAAAPYPSYSQTQTYPATSSRGDSGGQGHGGRGRGGHHGAGRGDYGSYYQNQGYTPPNPQPYSTPPSNGYWQGNSQMNGHSNPPPIPLANYHPNYAPQGYGPPQPPPSQGYQQPYPNPPPRPAYGASYPQTSHEYPQPQQWTGSPPSHTPHPGRGGRGGYHGGQPNKPEHMGPPIRMGFDQPSSYPQPPQPSTPGYAQSYNSHSHPQSAPFQPPPYAPYSPAPPTYHGPNHGHHGPGSRGRGGFGQSNRGRHHGGDHKNRHNKGQRPNNDFNSQKSEAVQGKKKKRKTNTLGLTPDDGEESNDDEEARLANLMGNEMPAIPADKLPDWLAERKAKYPTKARVQAKQEAEKKQAEEAKEAKKAKEAVKADDPESRDIEEEERALLQRLNELQKVKRKRDPNDEGDEMRNTNPGATDAKSEDDAPEVQSSRKPPPISSASKRADPQNHCKYYATGGNCGKKDKCRFRHDSATRTAALEERTRNGGKMTLKQRLILNDKDADDLDVVKAIIDLRFTDRLSGLPESQNDQDPIEFTSPAAPTSTLPGSSGAANLPPNPTTTHQAESKN